MDTHLQKNKNYIALKSLESPDHAQLKDHGWFLCTWFIGKRCNFDCSYCSALEHDNHSGHVSLDVVHSMVDQLKTHIQDKNKKFKMAITGGEPFVHPKFLDILELVKTELEPKQFTVVTNGSVPFAKYKKASEYLSHITFSYHLERTDKELERIFNNVQQTNELDVDVSVNLMCLPGKLKQVKDIAEKFIEHDIKYSIRDIEPNFTANGRMIQPYEPGYELTKNIKADELFRYTNRQKNVLGTKEKYYSNEEREFLNKEHATNYNNVRVFYDNGTAEETHTDQLIKHDQINFKNWLCYVGIDHMYVDWDGRVWTALCRQGGVIGNIHGKINFPSAPVKCSFDYCRCTQNIFTRKYKEPKYKRLVTEDGL